MRTIGLLTLACIGMAFPLSGGAASDSMTEAVFPNIRSDLPPNNMAEKEVLEKFGEPSERIPAIGNPPIARWKYPDYVVYYEWDRVIISIPIDGTGAQ
ncbi:MAG: hypothetical protein OES09_09085 [Gammaproteobacteria bacterium]|nr:hypothetical protein [Gammaproteobacteria bacterium]